MADINMKKAALQLLVVNEILTQEEVDKCINAISDDHEIIETRPITPSRSNQTGVLFEDSRICVAFKGMNKITNLFFGEGIEFKFIIHNKTDYEMKVNATDISINDFIISSSELLCSEATPNRKTIDNFSLYSISLDDVDVKDIEDIYSLELAISYEIEDLDIEYESASVEIDI